jgi:DNA-binding MarR family transcriptional regulator
MGSPETACAPHVSVTCLIEAGGMLRRSLHTIEKSIATSGDKAGLRFSQWLVLRALSSQRQMSIGEIGQKLGLADCTATRSIDQLEGMGLVARQRLSADRRVVDVSLTQKGRNLCAATESVVQDFWFQRTKGLSESEMAVFFGVLGRIERDAHDLPTKNIQQQQERQDHD